MLRYLIPIMFLCSSLSGEYNEIENNYCEQYELCVSDCSRTFYTSIGGGVVFPMKNSRTRGNSNSVLYKGTSPGISLFSLPDVRWKNKYDTGYEVNAILGYKLSSCMNAEGEFVYQNFERKMSGRYNWREINATTTDIFAEAFNNPIHKVSKRANLYALFSNGSFDLQACNNIVFSIGAGVGVAWLQANKSTKDDLLFTPVNVDPTPVREYSPKLFGTAFAWQVKLGLKYDIGSCFALGINYRLLGTTKFVASSSKIISNPDTDVEAVFNIPQKTVKGLLNSSINFVGQFKF